MEIDIHGYKIKNIKKVSPLGKFTGLMFRKRENADALLFDFPNPVRLRIHSFFVFFPFLAVWLDDRNRIIEKKIIQPFNFSVRPKKQFNRLIEIPFNKKYKLMLGLLVGDTKGLNTF
jgi:uncharacterized membrane protein (UPF0127 family)